MGVVGMRLGGDGANASRPGLGMHSVYTHDKLGTDAVSVAADPRDYRLARFLVAA